MPVRRTPLKRGRRRAGPVPGAALWWLEHGRVPADQRDGWQISNLHFDRATVSQSRFWTRADLRAAGYGPRIDELIEAGRIAPDRRVA